MDRSHDAFRSLFDAYAPRLRNFMIQQGADVGLAEELTQETMITVWRKAGLYSAEKGSATTWIYTIARNLRTDYFRRQRPFHELTEENSAAIPSEGPQADEVVDERQRQVRVQAVLRALPPDQAEVVKLAFIASLSHSEIAKRLALPIGTVKSRLRLAYQKLRTALDDLR